MVMGRNTTKRNGRTYGRGRSRNRSQPGPGPIAPGPGPCAELNEDNAASLVTAGSRVVAGWANERFALTCIAIASREMGSLVNGVTSAMVSEAIEAPRAIDRSS